MEFIETNITEADCLIVALYNSLLLDGRRYHYDEIKALATSKRWYSEQNGFKIRHLQKMFKNYGLEVIPTVPQIATKAISDRIRTGQNFLILTNGSYFGERGHAMVATKGTKGTKVVNSTWNNTGWKTFYQSFRRKSFTFSAYEIRKAS